MPLAIARRHLSATLLPALAGCSLALAGCGSDGSPSGPSDGTSPTAAAAMLDAGSATILYRHRDGSVPPPGYRERTLTVTPELSRLLVGDRETVLEDTTVTTELAAVEETLRRLSESDLPAVLDEGCAGGPSYRFEVRDATDTLLRGIDIVCPLERRSAGGELRTIVAPLLDQFDLDAG